MLVLLLLLLLAVVVVVLLLLFGGDGGDAGDPAADGRRCLCCWVAALALVVVVGCVWTLCALAGCGAGLDGALLLWAHCRRRSVGERALTCCSGALDAVELGS